MKRKRRKPLGFPNRDWLYTFQLEAKMNFLIIYLFMFWQLGWGKSSVLKKNFLLYMKDQALLIKKSIMLLAGG